MDVHDRCPTCAAPWVREEYQPVDRLVVACRSGHRFLVGELRGEQRYGALTPVDGEEASG